MNLFVFGNSPTRKNITSSKYPTSITARLATTTIVEDSLILQETHVHTDWSLLRSDTKNVQETAAATRTRQDARAALVDMHVRMSRLFLDHASTHWYTTRSATPPRPHPRSRSYTERPSALGFGCTKSRRGLLVAGRRETIST